MKKQLFFIEPLKIEDDVTCLFDGKNIKFIADFYSTLLHCEPLIFSIERVNIFLSHVETNKRESIYEMFEKDREFLNEYFKENPQYFVDETNVCLDKFIEAGHFYSIFPNYQNIY